MEAAVHGIRWAQDLFGLTNPYYSNLVKGILESAKRSLSRAIVKKEPVTPDMVLSTCRKFASANANLSDLPTAAICVTAFAGFLRFKNNELANLRCCDVKFCEDRYVELFTAKSKTDIYRNVNVVLLAGHITCPYNLLNRYIQAAGIDFPSSLMFFRSLHFV